MPKIYSLYSEASMFPRRSSHARKSRLESWLRVSLDMRCSAAIGHHISCHSPRRRRLLAPLEPMRILAACGSDSRLFVSADASRSIPLAICALRDRQWENEHEGVDSE